MGPRRKHVECLRLSGPGCSVNVPGKDKSLVYGTEIRRRYTILDGIQIEVDTDLNRLIGLLMNWRDANRFSVKLKFHVLF